MLHQFVAASCLSPLRPGHDARPALDEITALGFNAVRGPFAAALPWCGQELRHVYEGLPRFLGWCEERALNAYVPYVTEAGTGFDLDRHVDEVEAIARRFPKVVLREVSNEADHPSQGGRLSPERCRDLAARMAGPAAYGATIEDDESPKYADGAFVAVHLDRGRDKWNQVRRVREILAMSENTGKVACNQEPIGADEQTIAGKRESDPAFFFALGALNRLFLGGSGVFHSQAGLLAERLGPNQRRCAEAYLAGVTAWPGAHRLVYKNTTHDGGPVKSADFDKVTRVYSGVDGADAFTVSVGQVGQTPDAADIQLFDGWRFARNLGTVVGTDGRACVLWQTTTR